MMCLASEICEVYLPILSAQEGKWTSKVGIP